MIHIVVLLLIFSFNSNIEETKLNLLPSVKFNSKIKKYSNIDPEDKLVASSNSNLQLPILYSKNIIYGDLMESEIEFSIDPSVDLPSEGYYLKIEKNKIKLTGKDKAGLFYAFITLDQLIDDSINNKTSLPILSIKDFPSLAFRPIHLDLKHHTEKQSYYFELIDELAKQKINGIIVEFEDKLKYESRPEVGSSDSFSIDWWIQLSNYAKERNIMINPLVQGLGHASYILKHKKNQHLRDDLKSDWAFNPLNPLTYRLQFDLYLDAIKATPHGKYLHVGGDEVNLIKRDNKSELELNLIWLNKVCEFAEKHDRIPIFWDDMPLKHAGFWNSLFNDKMTESQVDELWNKNEINLMKFIEKFPKNAVYMRWNYQKSDTYGNLKAMDWYSKNDLKVMGASAGQTRWTLMPQNESNISQIRSFSINSIEKKLDGLLLTLWDDDSPHFELYKRGISAFSEYSWSGNNLSIAEFKSRYRYRTFGSEFSNSKYGFIDILEKPVEMWLNMLLSENGWRPGLSKKQNPLETDIIDLPDLNNKGNWIKKHSERIKKAKKSLEISKKVDLIIDEIQKKEAKNQYALDIYKQVNQLTKFSSELILKLEKVDKSGDLKHLYGIIAEFDKMRSKFEDVYSKTRMINKPNDYILDQDHHHHPANQTINFDWQFLTEIMLLEKINTTYNYENL
ncbi:MAG: family 20 glycosylhydrolase [Flavobacteriaceae bacterium]|nr:family 20 glycosylhydrolase [Flavobacteriaceae bacterium]